MQANSKTDANCQTEEQVNKFNIKVVNKERSIKYIDLDIERTFSYLGVFKGNSPLAEEMREILQAFVASRPDIGYVRKTSKNFRYKGYLMWPEL